MTLAEVARRFGLSPTAIRLISRRENAQWLVRTGEGKFVLRRFAGGAEASQTIEWELAATTAIAKLGWPVPVPIRGPELMDGWWWALFSFHAGRDLGRGHVSDAKYRQMGRLLAEFHSAISELPVPSQRPGWGSFVDGALPLAGGKARRAELLAFLARADAGLARLFEERLAALEARDLPALFAGVPRHIVHGDFSPWNLRFQGGRLSGLFDFELSHVDVAAADLAFSRRGFHDAVVEGYVAVRPLPEPQIAALDALWAGSLFFVAWSMLAAAERTGRLEPADFAWHVQQFAKTRPYRPA